MNSMPAMMVGPSSGVLSSLQINRTVGRVHGGMLAGSPLPAAAFSLAALEGVCVLFGVRNRLNEVSLVGVPRDGNGRFADESWSFDRGVLRGVD